MACCALANTHLGGHVHCKTNNLYPWIDNHLMSWSSASLVRRTVWLQKFLKYECLRICVRLNYVRCWFNLISTGSSKQVFSNNFVRQASKSCGLYIELRGILSSLQSKQNTELHGFVLRSVSIETRGKQVGRVIPYMAKRVFRQRGWVPLYCFLQGGIKMIFLLTYDH